MRTSFAKPLARLRDLDLITDSQRRALEAHPRHAELAALDDPVRQLLWMHAHKIISEDDLDDMMRFEEQPPERERILERTMEHIERANDVRTGRFLDALLRDGLISAAHRAEALRDPSGASNESAADVLYDLIQFDIMGQEEFHAVRKRVRAESSRSGKVGQLQVVEEVHKRIASTTRGRRWNKIRETAYAASMLVLMLLLLCGPLAYALHALHALWTSVRR